jgi:hypothetical protein
MFAFLSYFQERYTLHLSKLQEIYIYAMLLLKTQSKKGACSTKKQLSICCHGKRETAKKRGRCFCKPLQLAAAAAATARYL